MILFIFLTNLLYHLLWGRVWIRIAYRIIKLTTRQMDQSFKTMPVSIEFPSFAPSPQASPARVHNTFESEEIHRISIHLPDEYLEQ